jgi:2-methylcitrate dehydratase PrpD
MYSRPSGHSKQVHRAASAGNDRDILASPSRHCAIQKIRQKIYLKPSKELTIAKPARQAMVAITLDDGSIVSRHTKAVLGTPDNPMTTEQVQEKARDLIEPLLGREKCIELITSLEEFSGTQTVTDLFRRTLTVDHQLRS